MDPTNSQSVKDLEKDAYEMQHFRLSTRQVSEFITNDIFKEAIQNSTESLKEFLLTNFKDVSPTSIESAIETFLKAQHTALEKFKNQISNAVEEFFGVPPNAVLEEDALQVKQYTKTEEIQLDEEIALLKERAKRAIITEDSLSEELKVIQRVDALETMQKENLERDFQQSELKSQLSSNKMKCMLDIVKANKAIANDCFGSSIETSDGAAKRFQCS